MQIETNHFKVKDDLIPGGKKKKTLYHFLSDILPVHHFTYRMQSKQHYDGKQATSFLRSIKQETAHLVSFHCLKVSIRLQVPSLQSRFILYIYLPFSETTNKTSFSLPYLWNSWYSPY